MLFSHKSGIAIETIAIEAVPLVKVQPKLISSWIIYDPEQDVMVNYYARDFCGHWYFSQLCLKDGVRLDQFCIDSIATHKLQQLSFSY